MEVGLRGTRVGGCVRGRDEGGLWCVKQPEVPASV